jgi:hypothetical protein
MLISPDKIAPSQDFLKEKTVRFIFGCLREGNTEDLPPTPFVRRDEAGNLVAIDGHNLIAARLVRGEDIDVIVAESAEPLLPATTEGNVARNEELAVKFDTVLAERQRVASEGIMTFGDLVGKYRPLFDELSAA